MGIAQLAFTPPPLSRQKDNVLHFFRTLFSGLAASGLGHQKVFDWVPGMIFNNLPPLDMHFFNIYQYYTNIEDIY